MIKYLFHVIALSSCLLFHGCQNSASFENNPSAQNSWSVTRQHFSLLQDLPDSVQITSKTNDRKMIAMLSKASPYYSFVLSEVLHRNMPSEIALLPFVESNYNPFAYSLAGATGLWQMMPGTGAGLGLTITWWYDGRRDIVASTAAALDYLSSLHQRFNNDWLLAIAAYDAGAGRVENAIKKNKDKGLETDYWHLSLPSETKSYIPKLMKIAMFIKNTPNDLLPPITMAPYFQAFTIENARSLKDIADLSDLPIARLRALNPGFRRWETGPNTKYNILIPTTQIKTFQTNLAKEQSQINATPYMKYKIKPGDTLSQIAKRFHTTIHVLEELNALKTNAPIKLGKILRVPHPPHSWLKWHPMHEVHQLLGEHMPGPRQKLYIVKKGDSIKKIAKRFHIKPNKIIAWNQLAHQQITKGQSIQLWMVNKSCPKGLTHVIVKKGDNLSTIAKHAHTSVFDLKHKNHLLHDVIHPNQILVVPCFT